MDAGVLSCKTLMLTMAAAHTGAVWFQRDASTTHQPLASPTPIHCRAVPPQEFILDGSCCCHWGKQLLQNHLCVTANWAKRKFGMWLENKRQSLTPSAEAFLSRQTQQAVVKQPGRQRSHCHAHVSHIQLMDAEMSAQPAGKKSRN